MTMNTACYPSSYRGKALHTQHLQSYHLQSPEIFGDMPNTLSEAYPTAPWQTLRMTQRGAPQQSTHRNTVPHTAPWSPQRRPESLTNDGLQIDYSTYENPEPARSTERTGCGELAPSRGGPSGLRMEIRCWEHGCEGRKFSSLGNYRRHLREKNGQAKGYPCPDCGRVFTRSTARNYHKNSGTCGQNPRQLMLQMQMGLQLQAESHLLASPPLNVPSAGVFEPYIDPSSLTDLCSTSDAFLWGDTDKTSLYR